MEVGEPKAAILELARPAPKQPDEETVRLLEQVLEQARAGEVRCIALVGITDDGASVSAFTSNQPAPLTLVGALHRIAYLLIQAVEQINAR